MESVFGFLEFILFQSPQFKSLELIEFYDAISPNLLLVVLWTQVVIFYHIVESDEFASG